MRRCLSALTVGLSPAAVIGVQHSVDAFAASQPLVPRPCSAREHQSQPRRTHLYKRTRARRMAVGARAQPILSAGIEGKVLFATADKNACPVSG